MKTILKVVQYSAELYTLGENGQPIVEESYQIEASDLESAKQKANEWTMTVAGVLYKSKHIRLRKDRDVIWQRSLGEFFKKQNTY